MDIWIVLMEDRHADVEALPFSSEELAFAKARSSVPDDAEERQLTIGMRRVGLFTSPERARRVCQESANEYLGEKHTPALIWQGDDTSCSASYHHPGAGMQVFTIDMYELDKVQS